MAPPKLKKVVNPYKPFGISGGLMWVGIHLMIALPILSALGYLQVTFFYFTDAFAAITPDARTYHFYQFLHGVIVANIPAALVSGTLILGGAKFARKAANLYLSLSIIFGLFLLLSLPDGVAAAIPEWFLRPCRPTLAAPVILSTASLVYLNLSARCENTYASYHKFPVRRKLPWTFILGSALWSAAVGAVWLMTLFVYMDRYPEWH